VGKDEYVSTRPGSEGAMGETDAATAAAGLRALAAPGERRCGLPTREAIDVLAAGLADACLSPIGWVAAVNELAYAVSVQRKVETELAEATPAPGLHRPILVAGLPRCGSAHLHHLLAMSPSLRSAREWEVASPTARSEARRTHDDRIVRDAVRLGRVRIELLEVVAPQLPELAPVAAHSGEGCTQLLHHSLCSLQFLMMFRAPEYARWLCAQDLVPAYRFWADQLRLIEPPRSNGTGRADRVRWLGASPFHPFGYAAMWDVAPDANIVHVRRDPVAAFAAFVDVAVSVRMAFSDQVEPRTVAQEWLELWATMLRRSIDAVTGRRTQVVSVAHEEVRDNPAVVVSALCERLDVAAPPARATRALAAVLTERRREHTVAIEDVGLSRREAEGVLLPLHGELDRSIDALR
jgi:hypothetical protein